ncbi:NADH-ubiquinone oxidoreductase-F iron-sulfur binding region domain-containing protein [Elioraea sp.]|uniref:NADH-ubiquinone oxidoreductase-F iron-sulfur binding region domain-containing protein n=1 Tax=Elioraea sp. TaxID=2185103 RepID=UPI0025B96022|nr:NADH-ubiquinone oxidoreductase-F iron-sulfur binding region domain-containing protein [Elioraea sp.]
MAADRAKAPRSGPRGGSVDPAALMAVAEALDDMPRRPDMLVEALHAVQDRFGAIRHRDLRALAELFGLAAVVPYETATFYAHFDVIADDAPLPPTVTVRVCDGLPCAMAGAATLLAGLRAAMPEARIIPAPCIGACDRAPACSIGHAVIGEASVARVKAGAAHPPALPAPRAYSALAASPPPEALVATIAASGLRGLGGAGFPVARKWQLVRGNPGPRHLVVNADEGEPGTFKDRWCLAADPHRMLEGMLIAARAVEASACWIYLRDEYGDLAPGLARAIADIPAGAFDGPIHLRRGAGAYICGEETALLESLEGRRGYPRHKPPFPGQVGLFGQPTLIHNVETLWWLPEIITRGAEAFAQAGRAGHAGRRLISLSGRVREPGVKDVPMGITARALIDEFGGGMAEGHRLVAYLPGGASGGILPASMADLPLAFGALEKHGSFVGSGAVIVLSDHDDLAEAARNLARFFRDESCGQCTPCRAGTAKAAAMLDAAHWDGALLAELAAAMADGSICGLGQAAMNPVLSLIRHMPEHVP